MVLCALQFLSSGQKGRARWGYLPPDLHHSYGVYPESVAIKPGRGKLFEFNYDYCEGCGLCAMDCRRGTPLHADRIAGTMLERARRADAAKACVIIAAISGGLLLDQALAFWGQALTNVGVWALFLYWLRGTSPQERIGLTACVLYATLGEVFLSLIWGLYDYRLGNVPLFVPPGHALLFMLGALLAARSRDWIVWFVPAAAAPFVFVLALSGADHFGALLFALFLLCLRFGTARRLYAIMFVLALAMELYGTWLGNWAWLPAVPSLGLSTLNPPLAAGAFYCVLDLLVMATVARRGRRAPAAKASAEQTSAA